MTRRLVKSGEILAIKPDVLRQDGKAIWWDMGTSVAPNETYGDACIVNIRGELEHHDGFGNDSYEGIYCRVAEAFTSDAERVILRIDSPGGVVSGLNETVKAIRRLKETTGKALIAFVDELAASAAYGLATAADEIYLPPSAIVGSVGVISQMVSVSEADKKAGIDVQVITSGERKADGHMHAPLTDDAVAAERVRVMQAAQAFWKMVAKSRGMSVDEVRGLEAAIFMGRKAVAAGLADELMSFEDLLSTGSLDNGASGMAHNDTSGDENTMQAMKALLKKAEAKLAAEKDPKVKASLTAHISAIKAGLESYKKVKHTVEKHEEESGDEDEKDEEDEKGNETDRKADDDDKDDDGKDGDDDKDDEDEEESEESEEDEKYEEEEEEEEAAKSKKARKAALAMVAKATGAKGQKALGALSALLEKAAKFDALQADVKALRSESRSKAKNAIIDEALAARRITRGMAKHLRSKPLAFVEGTLEMHKRPMITTSDEELHVPSGKSGAMLSKFALDQIEIAVASAPASIDKAKLRENLIAAQQANAAQANGARETY